MRALITGITGQDGSYLAELLLSKGYEVYGLVRRTATPNYENILAIKDRVNLLSGDLLDSTSLENAIEESEPDEIYNLAAQSHVPTSFAQPIYTAETTGVGVARLLEATRKVKCDARFYQASTSEMFGLATVSPQDEKTPFYPRSPYGAAKLYAHWMAVNARDSYKMNVSCGILFNHESPRRSLEFVTRKITRATARISLGLDSELRLGNLDSYRDWGYAKDYVEAMWLMLQNNPDDFVVGSGAMHRVRDILYIAFRYVNLDWNDYVVQDERFMRPTESNRLCGDYYKANRILGWYPKTSFKEMIELMVQADLDREQ